MKKRQNPYRYRVQYFDLDMRKWLDIELCVHENTARRLVLYLSHENRIIDCHTGLIIFHRIARMDAFSKEKVNWLKEGF